MRAPHILAVAISALLPVFVQGQEAPNANPPPAKPGTASTTAADSKGESNGPSPLTGLTKGGPLVDPGSEILTWDGKNWNILNNRVFEARFEKYLNEPEDEAAKTKEYLALIGYIERILAPGQATQANLDSAFKLLSQASNYDEDAHLCDSLADAVYTVWAAQRQQQRLLIANNNMLYEIQKLEASNRAQAQVTQSIQETRNTMRGSGNGAGSGTNGKQGQQQGNQQQQSGQNGQNGQQQNGQNGQQQLPIVGNAGGLLDGPTALAGKLHPQEGPGTQAAADGTQASLAVNNWQSRRLQEMVLRQHTNDVKRELSEIQAKVEFQALLVQFLLQRRFQHVIIGTRFYRALFTDGDSKLNMGEDTQSLFQKSSGVAPTISTLDALANSAMKETKEGVHAFQSSLAHNELDGARKRLQEAFIPGEYMPEIRGLPSEQKRKVLKYTHLYYQLISAVEVKDYTLAEQIVKDLKGMAEDFDDSKFTAAVQTAKSLASQMLMRARNAAMTGDNASLEKLLREATELWPRNPDLAKMSERLADQTDVQQIALQDFQRLLDQKNYRQILKDSGRFIVASANVPKQRDALEAVLTKMKTSEAAQMRAKELSAQGQFAAAWEGVRKAHDEVPEDRELQDTLSELYPRAAEFIAAVSQAEDLEKTGQIGASMAFYLKARKIYPYSVFAREGIDRLKKQIFPTN